MEADEFLRCVERSAHRHDLRPRSAQVAGRTTLVATHSEFRWRWFATRLHTFLFVAAFEQPPTMGALDAYLDEAVAYAGRHKPGLPSGFQTGTASITVAVIDGASADAEAWAGKVHGRRFATLTWPAVVDLGSRTVTQPGRVVVGAVYSGHLRRMVDRHVAACVRAE